MNARKIANSIGVFFIIMTAVPLLAVLLPFAAAVWAYNETDDE